MFGHKSIPNRKFDFNIKEYVIFTWTE